MSCAVVGPKWHCRYCGILKAEVSLAYLILDTALLSKDKWWMRRSLLFFLGTTNPRKLHNRKQLFGKMTSSFVSGTGLLKCSADRVLIVFGRMQVQECYTASIHVWVYLLWGSPGGGGEGVNRQPVEVMTTCFSVVRGLNGTCACEQKVW